MSKSKGNVVDPDAMIAEVRRRCAAAVRDVRRAAGEGSRVDRTPAWTAASAGWPRVAASPSSGGRRFDDAGRDRRRAALTAAERALRRKTHDTIRRITTDIDVRQQLNTAIVRDDGTGQRALRVHRSSRTARRRRRRRRRGREAHRVADRDALAVCAAHGRRAVGAVWACRRNLAPRPGPYSMPKSPKAEEIVIPVQVNGKLRGRITVAPRHAGRRAGKLRWPIRRADRTCRARRSRRSSSPRGGSIIDCGGRETMRHRRRELSGRIADAGAAAVVSAACGYSLAGPRLVPARLHQDARHPGVRQSHAVPDRRSSCSLRRCASSSRAAAATRRAQRGRRGWRRSRQDPGISAAPVGFTDAQLGAATASPWRSVSVRGRRRRRRRCGRTRRWRSPTNTSSPSHQHGLDGAAFLGQERVAVDRMSTDFARSVV